MSATPIPRTLEMSLTGIREMSTILTPPEERHPVLTFVGRTTRSRSAPRSAGAAARGQVFFCTTASSRSTASPGASVSWSRRRASRAGTAR
jgi:transcription-repair coupling factor (superfamily II helicase)